MYRIIDDKSTGKTLRLMLIAKERNATFICADPHGMRTKAAAYGIIGIDFIDYAEALEDIDLKNNVVIDEIESFMKYCLKNNHLIGYTLSKEE